MRKFIISDRYTTADTGLEIEADSLSELFMAAAEGMFTIILGDACTSKASVSSEYGLAADSAEQLLVDWLSDLLYRFDTQELIPVVYRIAVEGKASQTVLLGTVEFHKFEAGCDLAEHEIKAVTYHKLRIREEKGHLYCPVVFDI